MSPAAPSSAIRRRGPLVLAATLVALAATAPSASAATGVFKGTGTDAAGDARSDLDVLGVDVLYRQSTGLLRATIRMGSKPPGDVDVLVGKRQANGACGIPFVTLSANAAAGTGVWRGSSGKVHAKAKVTYASGIVTASVTDKDLIGRTPSCAMAMSYGAGAARPLRDTLDVFDVTDQPATTGGTDDGTGEEGLPGDDGTGGTDGLGVDTDGDGIPDDFDGDGLPDDLDGDGIPDVLGVGGTGEDGGGGAAPAQLSVKVYGIPRRLRRGRSYEARIRIRNDGDEDATKLRVRLAKKSGVSMSRRVASVSRVRSGKGITVHIRVRLTSRQAVRTVRVTVTGAGVSERTSFKLRRRGAK